MVLLFNSKNICMKKSLIYIIALAIAIILLNNRNKHNNAYDEHFIPYNIKSFDVWVYNDDTDKEYYAGNVKTDYYNAKNRLCDAQDLAYKFAKSHHLKNWNYLCCTVTKSSNCVTKVR